MGGIVARRLIVSRAAELIQQAKIIGVFLIASPSLGSRYANLLADVISRIPGSMNWTRDAVAFQRRLLKAFVLEMLRE